ncbi:MULTISPECIES: DUF4351 domain-containing protein [Cylindrospermopsis]|uniref:DUF4351 domain-containing protein n=1 Tax=Cylindrospermopsis curvispora GIHE-G1 TaxID=2666332 RepID=A0A7H0F1P4_9CYAN|nr:DUF4351 domain-containing protein [Cylindrospermopsis curvispora]QNP29960.1 DUF4351 domain-containing protein [Cylindrospermopsis curvispora GIHE-G1]
MTRFIHDQFAKDYLEEILRPYGEIESSKRVPGEVRQIDCFFSPAGEKITELSGLGVLGSFARLPGIFEPFRNAAEEREDKELIMRLAPLYQQDIEKVRQEGLQEGELRGEQRGRQEGQRKIILLLLNHKFDGIELPVVERINRLSLEQLEALGESLLDFKQISDLEAWLKDAEKSNDLKPQVDIQNGNQLDV